MFFDTQTLGSPRLSMDHIRELSGEIANSYFNAGAIPTDTLVKIARTEELTPDQVRLVATEANKLIHHHKYAAADEKYFAAEFPLADAAQALKDLQVDGGETKIAARFSEPKITDRGPDAYAMFGVKPEVMDKTAEVKGELQRISIRGDLLQQKMADRKLLAKYAAEAAEIAFIKQARQLVLENGNSSPTRLSVIGGIAAFIKSAGMPAGYRCLAKLAHVLMREGMLEKSDANRVIESMEKAADQKAPSDLISPQMANLAQVVNGQHPLYMLLKTIADSDYTLHGYDGDEMKTDDRFKAIRQKIREL